MEVYPMISLPREVISALISSAWRAPAFSNNKCSIRWYTPGVPSGTNGNTTAKATECRCGAENVTSDDPFFSFPFCSDNACIIPLLSAPFWCSLNNYSRYFPKIQCKMSALFPADAVPFLRFFVFSSFFLKIRVPPCRNDWQQILFWRILPVLMLITSCIYCLMPLVSCECRITPWPDQIAFALQCHTSFPHANQRKSKTFRCVPPPAENSGHEKKATYAPFFLVAAVGFEPTTYRVWTDRYNQLSYAAIFSFALLF